MNLRTGLLGGLALAVALVLPLAPGAQTPPGSTARPVPPGAASAPAPRSLSIATLAPVGSTWMRAFDAWNRELRRRTAGALSLRFYPNGVQGDEDEVIRKIRSGRLDGGAVTAVGLSMIHRPTLAFQLPGLFTTYEQLDRARDALRPELDAAFHTVGFELLGWGDAGTDRIFANRPVRTPADMAPTRPWLWRDDLIGPAFFDELHAHAVPLQVGEVLTALQTRQVDTLWVSPVAVVSLQWAPLVTHMTDLPMGSEIGAIVLGRTQFESLPEAQRAVLRETAAAYSALLVRNVRRDDDGSIQPLRERGLQVITPTPAERAQWDAVFTRTRARLTGPLTDAAFLQRVQTAAAGH